MESLLQQQNDFKSLTLEEKVDNIKRRIEEFERDRLKRNVPADRPNPKPTHSDVDMLKAKLLRK